MKKVSVSGSRRENVGKKDAKALRRKGLVPCVVYGGKEQIQFSMPELSFRDIVYTPEACLIDLDVDGKKFNVVFQDAQFHPVTDKIIHCDFLEVIPNKPIKVEIPISVYGDSPGIIKGGKLLTKIRKLKVRGLSDDMPDKIDIDISSLDIGDSIKVNQMNVPNLEFLDYPNSVVVMVKMVRGAGADLLDEEEEEAEEAAAEEGESKEETSEE